MQSISKLSLMQDKPNHHCVHTVDTCLSNISPTKWLNNIPTNPKTLETENHIGQTAMTITLVETKTQMALRIGL